MNILLIVVGLYMLYKLYDGYKKGMVKELISLTTLLFMGIMVGLMAAMFHSYMKREYVGIIMAVILLTLLKVVHRAVKFVCFSLKLISGIPVISTLNKVLGMILGFLEGIVFLQVLFFMVEHYGLGTIGQLINQYAQEAPVVSLVYHYNVVGVILERIIYAIGSGM